MASTASDSNGSGVQKARDCIGQALQSRRLRLAWFTLFCIGLLRFLYFAAPSPGSWHLTGLDYSNLYENITSTITHAKDPGSGSAASTSHENGVVWSDYAYTQYVTNGDYLCNSVMLFEILHRLGSKADRLMMYPEQMRVADKNQNGQRDGALLKKARDEYGVKLQPIRVQHRNQEPTWADSYTKLLAFNQTQYKRVLNLDSDSTILQNMDELFLIPSAPLALPRAYWQIKEKPQWLSSQLLLIEPSTHEFARIKQAIDSAKKNVFDMEIVNHLYKDSAIIIPHRKYDLLSGEFRKGVNDHKAYLGNEWEKWDPEKILKEASFLHFSDWPMPKPWIRASSETREKAQPPCVDVDGKEDCTDRDTWLRLYQDFAKRRKEVCEMEPVYGRRRRRLDTNLD